MNIARQIDVSERPSIAIIGGGPGGLTAANVLSLHGWQFDLFEADSSRTSRDQGGSLDLHPEDGQVALKRAGLLDAFLAVARHEDQEQRVRDFATGNLLREEIPEPGSGSRPEIDRMVLRELMLAHLAPQTMHWGTRIDQVLGRTDGRYELKSEAGTFGPFDVVIGADGAWSKSRELLTDVRPSYTGKTFVELWLSDVDRCHPSLSSLVGRGTMFSLHGGAGLIAQRNGNASIRVYAAFQTRPEESDRPDKILANIDKSRLSARFSGWAPSLLALISESDEIAAVRPISSIPLPLNWPHRDGLTLIGDAAHVMPPLGVGVNLAMLDASDLALALISNDDWRIAQHQYEKLMFERTTPVLQQITATFDEWFGDDASQVIMDDFDSHWREE
ncbi:FAD-dependent oxidoreductase [Dyella sp. 20L07]|uniref:FAD-dependent oxidoreductase n=1 Tax=Dyella sp. 20L07 TaxID=3384240 RepID=UPI003D271E4E